MEKMDIERKRSFIINFTYFIIILVLAYIALKYALPLLGPFVIAFIIASLLQHPIHFVQRHRHFPQRLCAIITVALFFVMIGILLSLVGVEAFSSIQKLVQAIPSLYSNQLEPLFTEVFDTLEQEAMHMDVQLYFLLENIEEQFLQTAGEMVSNLSLAAVSVFSNFVTALPGLFIKLVLLVISTFFIAMDYERLVGFCLRQMNEKTRNLFLQVKNYVVGTLWVCIRSYALIMSITFVELSIGLSIIGIDHAILIAACISVFDILPVLGTGGIMLPWAAITAVLGKFSLALSLLLVYVIITIVRNILEPKIVGGQLGLHPVVTLSSMFAGAQLLGVIGLFGFPIFLSLLVHLNKTGTLKIFK